MGFNADMKKKSRKEKIDTDLKNKFVAQILALLSWIHRLITPIGEWISNGVLGAIEETTRSIVRGWFNAGSRYIHTIASLILSLFSGQFYGKAQRHKARRPQKAWSDYWSQATGTFNALLEREGLIYSNINSQDAGSSSSSPFKEFKNKDQSNFYESKTSEKKEYKQDSNYLRRKGRQFWKRWFPISKKGRKHSFRPLDFAVSGLFTSTSEALTVSRRGLVEDIRLSIEVSIARAFSFFRTLIRKFFFLDSHFARSSLSRTSVHSEGTPFAGSTPRRRSLWKFSLGPDPWEDTYQFAASDAILKAGYPLEEHAVQTLDGYIIQLHRIPRKGARDVVLFQHGVLDTSLGWVARGTGGSAAFAGYDAGFDVWLANTRANPPRMHIDKRCRGGRYWCYCADDLAMSDLQAQIEHIHSTKMVELAAESALTAGLSTSLSLDSKDIELQFKILEDNKDEKVSELFRSGLYETSKGFVHPKAHRSATVDCIASLHKSKDDVDHELARLRRSKSESVPSFAINLMESIHQHEFDSDIENDFPIDDYSEDLSVRAEIGDTDNLSDYYSPSSDFNDEKFLEEPLPYRLQAVGHSLGAACLLMNVVGNRMRGYPVRIDRLILLSPAGFHPRIPLLLRWCKWGMPLICKINDMLRPGYGVGLRLPSPVLRWITFKLFADIQHSPALLDLTKAAIRFAASGDTSDWYSQMSLPHYSPASMPTVSLHTANAIAQWSNDGHFRFYDYGSAKHNLEKHGVAYPPSVAENYHLFGNIKVDLIAGTRDGLVPTEGVRMHEYWLKSGSVAVSYQEFEFGHLEFTFGVSDEVVSYVLNKLRRSAVDVSVRSGD